MGFFFSPGGRRMKDFSGNKEGQRRFLQARICRLGFNISPLTTLRVALQLHPVCSTPSLQQQYIFLNHSISLEKTPPTESQNGVPKDLSKSLVMVLCAAPHPIHNEGLSKVKKPVAGYHWEALHVSQEPTNITSCIPGTNHATAIQVWQEPIKSTPCITGTNQQHSMYHGNKPAMYQRNQPTQHSMYHRNQPASKWPKLKLTPHTQRNFEI